LVFKTLQPIPSGPGEDESFSRYNNSSFSAETEKSMSWREFFLREPDGVVCAVTNEQKNPLNEQT
jgi:hypothetical protein